MPILALRRMAIVFLNPTTLCPVLSDGVQVQWNSSLGLSTDGIKNAENCTINNGSMVSISLQSTTQNRTNHQYYLPFRLYLKSVNRDTPNSWATTPPTSNVTAKLLDTDSPTIQSVTALPGTYASGQHVPITVTFNEFVNLSNATVTINGKVTIAPLSFP